MPEFFYLPFHLKWSINFVPIWKMNRFGGIRILSRMKPLLLVPLITQILNQASWHALILKDVSTSLGMLEWCTCTNKHLDLSHTCISSPSSCGLAAVIFSSSCLLTLVCWNALRISNCRKPGASIDLYLVDGNVCFLLLLVFVICCRLTRWKWQIIYCQGSTDIRSNTATLWSDSAS